MRLFYIYGIENKINGSFYIGKGNTKNDRWSAHQKIAKGGKEKYKTQYSAIHAAISKYGLNSFDFFIIRYYDSEDEAYLEEYNLINYLKEQEIILYNVIAGGAGGGSRVIRKSVSQETRKKISNVNKGKKRSPEQIEYLRKINTGRKHKPESCKNMGDSHKGEKHWLFAGNHTEATKTKISNTKKGTEPPNKGIPVSKEIRAKQSMSQKLINRSNKQHTEKTKKQISDKRQNQDMKYRISTDIKKKVIYLFDNDIMTKKQIAEAVGLTFNSVSKIIARKDHKTLRQIFSLEQKLEVIQYWEVNRNKEKMQDIANHFHIKKGYLERIIYQYRKTLNSQ